MAGMALTIREAVEGDAQACADIYRPYVTDTVVSFEEQAPTAAEMWQRMSEALAAHTWLIAEIAGQPVGYAYGHRFAPRAAYRWSCETSVYLDGQHGGQGIGRALYADLIEGLSARGFRTALAGIALPNAASVALHRSMGFTEAGLYHRVGWKLNTWVDVAWYQRDLGSADAPPAEQPLGPPLGPH
jgi:L-amino acid N-acyltransferase YncA